MTEQIVTEHEVKDNLTPPTVNDNGTPAYHPDDVKLHLLLPSHILPPDGVAALTIYGEGEIRLSAKAGDSLIIHVEPFEDNPPYHWAFRLNGELRHGRLWLRPAIDELPEQLLVDFGGSHPLVPISPEDCIGRIIGFVKTSMAPEIVENVDAECDTHDNN